jgi:hypothetical protein
MTDLRRRPGPKKTYPHRRHLMLRDDEVEAIEAEAKRQSIEYEEDVSFSEVVRQCIRVGLNLDD